MKKNLYFPAMRQLLIALVFCSPLLSRAQSTTLTPDHAWKDESKINWCPDGYGTSFCLFNGLIYAFNYTDNGLRAGAWPYIYLVNKDHNYASVEPFNMGLSQKNMIDNFGFPGESSIEYYRPPLLGPIVTFQYQGRLWYYEVIKNQHQEEGGGIKDLYYECWSKLPTAPTENPMSYYYTHNGSPSLLRHAAFQVDSLLCFIIRNNFTNQWMIEEYYPQWKNDQVTGFYFHSNYMLSTTLNHYAMVGGYIPRKDSLDHQYFIFNFYNEAGDVRLWRLTPDTSGFPRNFTETDLGAVYFPKPVVATAIAPGTIKGCRTADYVSDKTNSDRMVVFGLNKDATTYGHNMQYKEYIFHYSDITMGIYGDLAVSNNYVPSKAGKTFQIKTATELVSMDYTQALDGNDGYQGYTWVFYPDDNKNFRGQQFVSDQWRLDPKEIPYSEDLSNDGLYDGISDMWTLVGVIDGPPPVSVNWPVWNVNRPNTPASTLILQGESSSTVKVAKATNDQWTLGETLEFTISWGRKSESMGMSGNITPRKKGYSLTFSETIKYTQAYFNMEKGSTDTSVTLSYPYKLSESRQDSGTFIYLVPKMKRYRYNLYPWWETNDLKYPLAHSTQYMFRTYGLGTVNRNKPLSKSPFLVSNANSPDMHDWLSTVRPIQTYIIDHDKQPALPLDWDDNNIGSFGHITTSSDTAKSHAVSKTCNIQGSVTFENKNPAIFKVSKISGFGVLQGKYTTESTVKTEFGNAVTLSLSNLNLKSDGLNISSLHESVYLFTWDQDSTLWVYDSLPGSYPWYIAYTVGGVSKNINLVSPASGSILGESELIYNWEVEGGQLTDSRIVISRSPQIDKGTIIYQQKTDALTASGVPVSLLVPGKTYYWAVTGKDENGQPVWSPSWSFTLKKEETVTSASELKASIYPNPGKNEDMRILVSAPENEPIELTLLDMGGRVIGTRQYSANGSGNYTSLKLPADNLQKGIYLLIIKTIGEQVLRKVVIN